MDFAEVEEAFEQANEALRNLQSVMRKAIEPVFTCDARRGTQEAWDDKQVVRQLMNELRQTLVQTSAVVTMCGNQAVKPKRDQSGRKAAIQERLEHYRRG